MIFYLLYGTKLSYFLLKSVFIDGNFMGRAKIMMKTLYRMPLLGKEKKK